MRIKFISTHRMSEDGQTLKLFEEGNTYDVADTAARTAISEGWAREPTFNETHDRLLDATKLLLHYATGLRGAAGFSGPCSILDEVETAIHEANRQRRRKWDASFKKLVA